MHPYINTVNTRSPVFGSLGYIIPVIIRLANGNAAGPGAAVPGWGRDCHPSSGQAPGPCGTSPVSTLGSSGRGPGKSGSACSAEMGNKGSWEGSNQQKPHLKGSRGKTEACGLRGVLKQPPPTLPGRTGLGEGTQPRLLKSKGTEIHLGCGKMKKRSPRRLVPVSHLGRE